MPNDIFKDITEYASRNYYDRFAFNNEEYADIREEILKLQEQYADMGLSDSQKQVIDDLLKTHSELCDECMEKVYTQGLKDCVSIQKELGIL